MNIRKPIAFVAAVLITAAGMTGIANYTSAAVARADQGINATTDTIRTLPAVNVYPTREQWRQLQGERAQATPVNLGMPYYSFASDAAGA